MDDARRAEEKESLRLHYIEDLKAKMEDERQRMESHIRKLEQDVNSPEFPILLGCLVSQAR